MFSQVSVRSQGAGERYPSPGWGVPPSGTGLAYSPYLGQDWDTPHPGLGYHPQLGWGTLLTGLPRPGLGYSIWLGWTIPPGPGLGYLPGTGYPAGGMPLAVFRMRTFLLFIIFHRFLKLKLKSV